MPGAYDPLLAGIVCILDQKHTIIGAGFVLSISAQGGKIATCTHVIEKYYGRIHDSSDSTARPTIYFQFEVDDRQTLLEAVVERCSPSDTYDISILSCTTKKFPSKVRSLPLGQVISIKGHQVSTFGFPHLNTRLEGLWARNFNCWWGTMNKNLGYRILQLESNNISEGFSGAPVWDDARRCVIGMITEIKVPDKYGRLGHISFAVPSTYLQELSNLPVKPATVLHSLTPLTEAEAHLFVGDQDTMNRLAWRLQDREHFLVILGADAVGKTSTIQAGLIPQMRNGVIHGYEEWGFLSVTLSENPFIELETQGLAEASANLLESIHAWCQKNACPKMVLIIDKFEEVLQTCPEPLQTHFISQLTTIIENGEATIILILRDDFYHLLARHKPLITYVEESIVNIVPPHKHADLVEIAQKNAATYNTNVDPQFIESVIDKAKRSFEATPGQSSLIQLYAMQWMHIWKQLNNPGMLDASTINIDTLPENTADLAEKLFETLTQQEQNFVQHAFISLVKPGNPTTSIPDICRTLPLITLCQNELEQEILYRFADAGLLMTGRDLQTNAEVISISQNSLLTTWPRLKEWLAQEREFYVWREQFRARLAQQPNISSAQALLSQNELLKARFWFNQREAELTQSEKSLIQASITQQNQAKRQEQQEKRSMLQRQHAHSIELAQQAHTLRNQAGPSLETSVLLAIEAMRSFPCPEAYQALYQSLILLPRLEWHLTHPGKIATATFSRSGSYLVTVDEHTIGVIGLKKGSSVACHLESPTPICNSALSLNERYLATDNDDAYVIIWDIQQGKIRFQLEQNSRVHLVALSSDTSYPLTSLAEKAPIQMIASASLDGPIFIAPVDPGEQQYRYTLKPGSPVHTMAFHPTSPHLVTASKAGRVQIWNAVTGHRIGQIKIPGQVSLLAFSQQGEYLAIINDEGLLRIWDWKPEQKWSKVKPITTIEENAPIQSVAFSSDGIYLATMTRGSTIINIWRVQTGEKAADITHQSPVTCIAFNHDLGGTYLATASEDQTARIWNVSSRQEHLRFHHTQAIHAIAFSPNDMYVATTEGEGNSIARIWQTTPGNQRGRIHHESGVTHIASSLVSPDNYTIATTGLDTEIQISHMTSTDFTFGAKLFHEDVVRTVHMSPDGRFLISTGDDHVARIWSLPSGQMKAEMPHRGCSTAVALSNDGLYLILASEENVVWRWSLAQLQADEPLEHNTPVKAICFNSDNTLIATGEQDGTVHIWQAGSASSKQLVSKQFPGSISIAWNFQGDYLAIDRNSNVVDIWQWSEGENAVRSFKHSARVTSLTWSSDENYLATSCEDGIVRIWDIRRGEIFANFPHEAQVQSVAFSPDGQYLASACNDNAAHIWKITRNIRLGSFPHANRVQVVSFSPDGKYLLTGSEDRTAAIWLWQQDDLIHEAAQRLNRNLTYEEWREYMGEKPYRQTVMATDWRKNF